MGLLSGRLGLKKLAFFRNAMIGLLAGLLTRMRTDEDYAAWHELKKISERMITLEKEVSELIASIEIAKVRCMAGILQAKNIFAKRRIPYHQLLTMLTLFLFAVARSSQAQTAQRYEGILIDTSGSIGKGNANSDLLREYLLSTKKLLLTEPPNTRVGFRRSRPTLLAVSARY